MSIIFPLFGSNQQKDTDGYFMEGGDLKRIKPESFEIDTIFSNVNGFFVDRKENLYISQGGSIKKYIKSFITNNFSLAWTISGGFSGGSTVNNNSSGDNYIIKSYPFTSDFQSVAVDSQFNFYFRDTTDSNKLKKYSAGGQLIASTSSDIGEFAVNKDNIISFSGNTVTKRDLSGNSVSSFTVTGDIRAVNSDRVFTEVQADEVFFRDNDPNDDQRITFNKINSYDLANGNLAWSIDRITKEVRVDTNPFRGSIGEFDYIPLKNGNLLIRVYGRFFFPLNSATTFYSPFHGYVLINSSGSIIQSIPKFRITGSISVNNLFNNQVAFASSVGVVGSDAFDPTSLNQYLYTQGANSDRSRLNF